MDKGSNGQPASKPRAPNSETYSLKGNKPLPPIDGPKTGPFLDRDKPIEFIELLGDVQPETQGVSGGQGYVFHVRIGGQEYALKVFKFYDVIAERQTRYWRWRAEVDSITMNYHSDPFFAECRAYGRIEEIQRRRQRKQSRRQRNQSVANVAVPCHGFISLPAVPYESMFRDRFGIHNWDRWDEDLKKRPKKRQPFRALVKTYVAPRAPIRNPWNMAQDLRLMHKNGIVPRDVCERNYVNGFLVDFGIAWTEPHWSFRVMRATRIDNAKENDLNDFDAMLEEADISVPWRLSKDQDTYMKLRRLPNQPRRTNVQSRVLVFERSAPSPGSGSGSGSGSGTE